MDMPVHVTCEHFSGNDVEFLAQKSESELHSVMESLDISGKSEIERRTTEFCCLTKVEQTPQFNGTIVNKINGNKLFGSFTETRELPWACKPEVELHSVMASLDISEDCKRKTLQSFVPPIEFHSVAPAFDLNNKRRCQLLPKKRCEKFVTSSSGTNRRGLSKSLETIYEESCIMRSELKKRRLCDYRKARRKLRLHKLREIRKMNMNDFIARFHDMMGTNENCHCRNLTQSSASIIDKKTPDN